ncbi:MAG: PAAR domain-containing protein [Byssovorax sp.]
MKPAARITDPHTCPMTDPSPHTGGPVLGPGAPAVLIENLPASLAGDACTCAGPPDAIAVGSSTVIIAEKPAVRVGDATAHGGTITAGAGTVIFGD